MTLAVSMPRPCGRRVLSGHRENGVATAGWIPSTMTRVVSFGGFTAGLVGLMAGLVGLVTWDKPHMNDFNVTQSTVFSISC